MTKSDMDKIVFALLSKYINLYQIKYDKKPILNKHKEKWAMKSLVEDFGQDEVSSILDYYFMHSSKEGRPLNYFFNNFDLLITARNNLEKDNAIRAERRKEMQRIRQEYINGYA